MIPKWSSGRFPRQTGVPQSGFPDRLGRSLSHLLSIVNALKEKQVAFRSLTEGMDTTTASGERTTLIETEESRRSIQPAYHGRPAKLQHFRRGQGF
jgi:hypothetical protein